MMPDLTVSVWRVGAETMLRGLLVCELGQPFILWPRQPAAYPDVCPLKATLDSERKTIKATSKAAPSKSAKPAASKPAATKSVAKKAGASKKGAALKKPAARTAKGKASGFKAAAKKSAVKPKKIAASKTGVSKSADKKAPVDKVPEALAPVVATLRRSVLSALEEMKAKEIVEIDIRGKASFADLLFIASGTSTRHVKSLADEVVKFVKKAGMMPLGVEGQKEAEWVLVDLGDIVCHLMLPRIRDFYALERLWSVGGDQEASND